jgi:hypothetical protein
LEEATRHFNISVDLIYGVPGMSNENGSKISKRPCLSDSAFPVMLYGGAKTALKN